MIIPKPLVAYCKEKMRGRREFHSQIIAHQEVGEDVPASARGSIQIELQQVFIKDVIFSKKIY
jgi:hypothetical protein